ncbi:hypothetical protein KI387_017458, partial [Taxus chinensis]
MQPEHQDQHQQFLGIALRHLSQSTLSGGHSFSEISLILYPVATAYSQLLPHDTFLGEFQFYAQSGRAFDAQACCSI